MSTGFGPNGMYTYAQRARTCEPATVCDRCDGGDHEACDGAAWTIEGFADGCVCRFDNGCGEVATATEPPLESTRSASMGDSATKANRSRQIGARGMGAA